MTLSAHIVVRRPDLRLDIAFEAAQGEVVAVLGPNGAGKTTLLQALAGTVRLDDGRVTLDGRPLEDVAGARRVPAHERHVGVVHQDYRLFPHLSVLDNVAFGLRSRGTKRAESRDLAREWLHRVDLDTMAARRPGALSGGQAQRVALARALITSPRLLLLDEPLAALDTGTRTQMRAELRRHLAGFVGPTLLVTHDPVDAMTLAGRIIIIEAGCIVQDDSPTVVAERPATAYAAQVVGLTLFRGLARGGVLTVDGDEPLALVTAEPALNGAALAVVRPSSVLVSTAPPATSSARNVWPRRIAALESVAGRVRVTFDGTPTLHADITAAAVAEMRLATGDRVWASVKATDITAYADPL
jgi:molybdate transport system ATP-binding protein